MKTSKSVAIRRVPLMLAFISAGILPITPAVAFGSSGATADAWSIQNINLQQNILTKISNMESSVVSAVNSARDAIVSAIGQLSQAQTQQIAQAAEQGAQTTRETASQSQKNSASGRYDPTGVCSSAASGSSGGGAGGSARNNNPAKGGGVGGGGAPDAAAGSSSPASQKNAILIGKNLIPTPSVPAQTEIAASGACAAYAQGNLRAQLCQQAGLNTTSSSPYPNADVRAETLINGPQPSNSASQFRNQLTLRDDQSSKDAIESFVRNLERPIAPPTPNKAQLKTAPGRQALAVSNTLAAQLSLASKPNRDWIGGLTADKNNIPILQQMLDDPTSGAYVQKYLAAVSASGVNWSSSGVSSSEIENLEVERRAGNPDWYTTMMAGPPETVSREMLFMQAAQHRIALAQLHEQRLTNILLGGLYAAKARSEYEPLLSNLLSNASTTDR